MDFSTIKSLYIPEGEVTKISTPAGVLWQKKATYTELEYLHLDGTMVFDTGLYGNLDSQLECKWQRDDAETAMYLYGCASDGNTASLTAYSSNGGSWRFGNRSTTISTNNTTLHTSTHNKTRVDRDGSKFNYATVSDFTTPYTILVGSGHNATGTISANRFIGKIYYFRMLDDGELVADWIPVNYEGVNGFWDKVTNTFVPPMMLESIPATLEVFPDMSEEG